MRIRDEYKMRTCAILVLLFAVVATTVALSIVAPRPEKRCCPPNEVWSDCTSPEGPCERDCQNRGKEVGCAAVCRAKCYCDIGYLRQLPGGKCVREHDCPGKG